MIYTIKCKLNIHVNLVWVRNDFGKYFFWGWNYVILIIFVFSVWKIVCHRKSFIIVGGFNPSEKIWVKLDHATSPRFENSKTYLFEIETTTY